MKRLQITINRTIRVDAISEAEEIKIRDFFEFNDDNNNFYRMIYVIDGKINCKNFSSNYLLCTGDFILIRTREHQSIENADIKTARVILLTIDVTGYDVQKISGRIIRPNALSLQKLNILADNVRSGIWNSENYFLHEFANLTEIFLISLIKSDDETHMLNSRAANEFKNIVEIMRNNVEKPLNVKDIAEKCGMSESNLKKIFSKYSVCSVHRYFLKMKIFKAIELLDNDYNVAEISEILSFNNQNYFGVVFKKETGYSPLNYRKKFLRRL